MQKDGSIDRNNRSRVLLLSRVTGELNDFAEKLQAQDIIIDTASYDELQFWLDGENSAVNPASSGEDIRSYNKVISLVTPYWWQAYRLNALACYCRRHQVELVDDEYAYFTGKLYQMWKYWEVGLPVPQTASGDAKFLQEILETKFGGTGILKTNNGSKGQGVFLVKSSAEVQEIMQDKTETVFLLQNFIPNQGDYRVILFDYEPKMVIYRSACGKDYRNNTALGGKATLIPVEQVDSRILDLAIKAAKAYKARIAGADIIQNAETGQYYVLEVNHTPQLASGTFVDEKAVQVRKFLEK